MVKPNDYADIIIRLMDHKPQLNPGAVKHLFSDFLNHPFSILHVNIRSFHHKLPQLEFLLAELDINFFLHCN